MKNFFSILTVFVLLTPSLLFASPSTHVEKADTYEYDLAVTEISGVKAPYISGNYIVFTAPVTARSVGIAFDFENFRKIHYFKLRKNYGYDGELTSSYYFHLVEIPKKREEICYRLIIDGLWTIDPNNNDTVHNEYDNYTLSRIKLPVISEKATEERDSGTIHFVCTAESGQKIRLGGTFTNWDSWIYEMTETAPGLYEIDIPLHSGTYYYAYYTGITSFLDPTNPLRGYSADGKIVSCITVN